LRTTNPIESVFATARHRMVRTRARCRQPLPSLWCSSWPSLHQRPSVLSLTFESQHVANMIHSQHGKRLDCT
jgi:hypothetical protein